VALARLDSSGKGIKGKITYFDPNDAEVKEEETDDHGVKVIGICRGEKKETVSFSPSEKPGLKIEKEIPAKKATIPATQNKQQEPGFFDRVNGLFQLGRQIGRKIND